jgi:hypothetical protein
MVSCSLVGWLQFVVWLVSLDLLVWLKVDFHLDLHN